MLAVSELALKICLNNCRFCCAYFMYECMQQIISCLASKRQTEVYTNVRKVLVSLQVTLTEDGKS